MVIEHTRDFLLWLALAYVCCGFIVASYTIISFHRHIVWDDVEGGDPGFKVKAVVYVMIYFKTWAFWYRQLLV